MFKPLVFVIALTGAALAQPSPDIAAAQTPTPQPQAPVVQPQPQQQTYVAPVPFGGLYNTLNGNPPPAPGQPQPLTPFNATP